jgi:hypothetical protein
LPALVTTTDINEINVIKTDTTTVVEPKTEITQPPITNTTGNFWLSLNAPNGKFQVGPFTNRQAAQVALSQIDLAYAKIEALDFNGVVVTTKPDLPDWKDVNTKSTSAPASVPATVSVVNNTVTPNDRVGASAVTIYQWYQAQGQSLPSVSARSVIYEGFGLGSRNYYTGTSEQNTKLLSALKAQ